MPGGIITPGRAVSLEAGLNTRLFVPSFTEETVLLPIPPKKPTPFTVKVTVPEPIEELRAVKTGRGVVTEYLSETEVGLDPPPL